VLSMATSGLLDNSSSVLTCYSTVSSLSWLSGGEGGSAFSSGEAGLQIASSETNLGRADKILQIEKSVCFMDA